MVDVYLDHSGLTRVPHGLGNGQREDDAALRGLRRIDAGFTQQGLDGHRLQQREAELQIGNIVFLDRLGCEFCPIGIREGEVEVIDEDGHAQLVVQPYRRGDEEYVLRLIRTEHDGVGLVDRVGRQQVGVDVVAIDARRGKEVNCDGDGQRQRPEGDEDGQQQGTARGLGEVQLRHRRMVAAWR